MKDIYCKLQRITMDRNLHCWIWHTPSFCLIDPNVPNYTVTALTGVQTLLARHKSKNWKEHCDGDNQWVPMKVGNFPHLWAISFGCWWRTLNFICHIINVWMPVTISNSNLMCTCDIDRDWQPLRGGVGGFLSNKQSQNVMFVWVTKKLQHADIWGQAHTGGCHKGFQVISGLVHSRQDADLRHYEIIGYTILHFECYNVIWEKVKRGA